MKAFINKFQNRLTILPMVIAFCFSLQSFKLVDGIQIEKRHYRKGYYVHICHCEKTKPAYTVVASPETKKQKSGAVKSGRIQQQDQEAGSRTAAQRNNAPVSRAPESN